MPKDTIYPPRAPEIDPPWNPEPDLSGYAKDVPVSASDNGKVMTVVNGEWSKAAPAGGGADLVFKRVSSGTWTVSVVSGSFGALWDKLAAGALPTAYGVIYTNASEGATPTCVAPVYSFVLSTSGDDRFVAMNFYYGATKLVVQYKSDGTITEL